MSAASQRPVALITGASSGIGEGFARHLARDGYDLVLVARRRDRLEQIASGVTAAHGIEVAIIDVDLSKEEGVSQVERRLRDGGIDLLVNNAGFGTVGEFAALPLDRELEELNVNVRALMRLAHAGLNAMSDGAAIINIASTAAFQPIPYNATYAATKAFVLHFSEGLHEEAKTRGVTVTCVCPGPVKTEFQQVAGIDQSFVPQFGWESVDSVVRAALGAARSGRAVVVPGAINMVTAASARLTPHFITRRVAGSIFRRAATR